MIEIWTSVWKNIMIQGPVSERREYFWCYNHYKFIINLINFTYCAVFIHLCRKRNNFLIFKIISKEYYAIPILNLTSFKRGQHLVKCRVLFDNNYSIESNGHNSKSVTYFVRIIYGVKVWFFILITLVQPRYTISIKVVVMRHHEKKLFLEFNRTIGTFHLLDFNFKTHLNLYTCTCTTYVIKRSCFGH